MAVKTFTSEVLTSADTNTYLANSGLVYVTSVTVGTGVASVTVSSCFSSTYDAYRIVFTAGVASTTDWIYFQLSGLTGNNYFSQGSIQTSGNGTYNGVGYSGQAKWQTMTVTIAGYGGIIDVHNPNLAKFKFFNASGASDYGQHAVGGVHNTTGTATGFVVNPGSGTLTGGTITVYGYRKA